MIKQNIDELDINKLNNFFYPKYSNRSLITVNKWCIIKLWVLGIHYIILQTFTCLKFSIIKNKNTQLKKQTKKIP